jgi:aspartate beta-hydroxylase
LKEAVPDIQREFAAVHASKALPNDYLLKSGEATLHKASGEAAGATSAQAGHWAWYSYVQKGERLAEFALHCPQTAEAMEAIPDFMPKVGRMPFPYAFFSVMAGKTRIEPHFGPTNTRLRVHVPLQVPEDGQARLVVAGQELRWKEGEPIVFDDSYEHAAVNDSPDQRVVLLFDVWHPDLTFDERRAICDMFEDARQQGWMQ